MVDGNMVVFDVDNGVLDGGTYYDEDRFSWGPAVFSPNGEYFARAVIVDIPGKIILYTVTNGVLQNATSYDIPDDRLSITSLVFSMDGKYLAVVGDFLSGLDIKNKIVIFELLPDGKLSKGTFYSFPSNTKGIASSIAYSADGSAICTANRETSSSHGDITVFKAYANGTLDNGTTYTLPSPSTDSVQAVFSPNENFIATANGFSNDISIITSSNSTSYPLPSHSEGPAALAFLPGGEYIVTANALSSDITFFKVNSNSTLEEGVSYTLPKDLTGQTQWYFLPMASPLPLAVTAVRLLSSSLLVMLTRPWSYWKL